MKKLLDLMPKTKALLGKPSRKQQIINAIREVYTIDDEIAILRQKETKPEEFKAYFDFVEEIKKNVGEWLNVLFK